MKIIGIISVLVGVALITVSAATIVSSDSPVGDPATVVAGLTPTTAVSSVPEAAPDTTVGQTLTGEDTNRDVAPATATSPAIDGAPGIDPGGDGDVAPATEPTPAPPLTPAAPTRITVPALGVEAEIIAQGVAVSGQMEVPDNVTDVGWYRFGSSPGEAGSAVLAAHVDLAGQGPGVFYDLSSLVAGDRFAITFDDGTTADFRVVAGATYDKQSLPLDAIFSRQGPSVVTLITCGGGFSASTRSYDSNVVVYAVPVDDATPTPDGPG